MSPIVDVDGSQKLGEFDLPVILGPVVLARICVIRYKLFVDLVYAGFDGRIRHS